MISVCIVTPEYFSMIIYHKPPFFTNKRNKRKNKNVAKTRVLSYNVFAALGGEPAVPCTCNPLQQDRKAVRGRVLESTERIRSVDNKVPCNIAP